MPACIVFATVGFTRPLHQECGNYGSAVSVRMVYHNPCCGIRVQAVKKRSSKEKIKEDFVMNQEGKVQELEKLPGENRNTIIASLQSERTRDKKIPYRETPVNKLFPDGVTIKEVLDKKRLKIFIDFPNRLYKGSRYYVPQLKKDIENTFDQRKNPAYEFCEARYWLAYKENRVVGRIAGVINHAFNDKWGKKYVRFGWIDFEKEEGIARQLLEQVEEWAREKGMEAVHGPLGFTNFDYAGMLTEGFSETGTFATIYNYSYYPELVEKAGYKKETGWVEYKIKITGTVPEIIGRAAAVVEKRLQLKVIRPVKMKEILPFALKIFELINTAYDGLFGVVPMTDKQVQYNISKYLGFLKPEFVSIILDKNGDLAAFGITMPSLSNALQKAKGKLYPFGFLHLLKAFRKNKYADLCLVAVRRDLQGKGVNAILIREINEAFIRNGIEYVESNPELEENTRVQSQWDYYEKQQHKRRICYIKYL
ncbi:MAG: GNAT family N-acetyltransferase [Ferruginibacter sp.]